MGCFWSFFKQKLENKAFTVVGKGDQKRDFVYVSDVVDAFFKCSQSKYSGEIFNLGTEAKSINYLVKIWVVKKLTSKRPGEPHITCANPKKIKKMLKWKPKVKFESGVKLMMLEINKWKSAHYGLKFN